MSQEKSILYEEKRRYNKARYRIFILIPLVILIIGIFHYQNLKQIQEQNAEYVKDAAVDAAKRFDETINRGTDEILMYADLQAEQRKNESYFSHSMFDKIFLLEPQSQQFEKLAQTDICKKGFQGKNGIEVDFSRILSDEVTVNFYAPVYHQRKITGVLVGVLGQEELESMLASKSFGEVTETYLVTDTGRIISCADGKKAEIGQNLFGVHHARDILWSSTLGQNGKQSLNNPTLKNALQQGKSFGYSYHRKGHDENSFIVTLQHSGFALMKTFPRKVTVSMSRRSMRTTFIVSMLLLFVFAAYIIILIISQTRQQHWLIKEKERVNQILAAFYGIYDRFCVVDLENDNYEFLKLGSFENQKIPKRGVYSELLPRLQILWGNDDKAKRTRRKFSADNLLQTLNIDHPVYMFEFESVMNGRKWLSATFIGLDFNEETPCKIIYAIQNVTREHEQMVKMNEMLKKSSEDAEVANAAKTDFLSRMSHDMRTPLNGILGSVAIAERYVDDPDKMKDFLSKIQISGEYLLELINETLDMSKMEAGKMPLQEEPVQLRKLYEECYEVVRKLLENKKIKFQMESQIVHSCVLSDKVHLEKIFVNLLSNAVKYTPEGGTVQVRFSEEPCTTSHFKIYVMECEDSGIGMSQEFIKKAFEPFARAEDGRVSKQQGTGLGLPITRSIAHLMGGDISVKSELGKGSLFRVHVMLRLDENEGREEEVSSDRIPSLEALDCSAYRCLVVEDNELNREISAEMLSMTGIALETACNGQQAVEKFSQTPAGYYDLILMDIQMPVMDGYEATRQIRQMQRNDAGTVPIIALTANAYAEDIKAALDAGMNEHMVKPIKMPNLAKVLKKYLG